MTPLPSPVPGTHDEPGRHPGSGTGMQLWLLRHAEVHPDWQGRAYGNLDVPLSAAGRERTGQAAVDFARLEPTLILSSPLERARRMGLALARQSTAPILFDDRLAEINRGSWQGLAVSELHERYAEDVRAFYADPWTYRGHSGESDAMVSARCWATIDEALGGRLHPDLRAPGGRLVVTTHYNVIRVLAAGALGIPPARSFALRIDPGRATALVDDPGGWTLVHSNVAAPPALEELTQA